MLTGTQEGAQRNIFTTEQICQIELIKGRRDWPLLLFPFVLLLYYYLFDF